MHKGRLALESEVLDATGDIGEKSLGDKEGLSVAEDDGLCGDNGVRFGLGLAQWHSGLWCRMAYAIKEACRN